jgi:signal transduction histidine kinase
MNDEHEAPTVVASAPDIASQRMADLAAFADGVAHDIRNPLSVIRNNVYLLRQQPAGQEPRAERSFQRIEEQIDTALHLLNGVQAFSRARQPNWQRVSLNEAARALARSAPLPESFELQLELEEDLPAVTGDPQLLDAALRALLRNSVEAGGGGVIRVRTRRKGEQLRLEAEDGGPGIPAEQLPHVFEPFWSTRRAHCGLGLTLVALVAHLHRGTASLSSREGAGTRVAIELPVEGPRNER